MEQLKLDSKFADEQGEIMVVECGGYVDQSNSHRLQKIFDNILDSNVYNVIVDFTDLKYMSSAGWGIFVGEIKRFRDHGGDIKLAAMNPDIYDVYQMLEFYHILEDYADVKEAALAFITGNRTLVLVQEYLGDAFAKDSGEEETEEQEEGAGKEDSPEVKEGSELEVVEARSTGMDEILEMERDKDMDKEYQSPIEMKLLTQIPKEKFKPTGLPLSEKIKHIVAENPYLSLLGIRRVLSHEDLGSVRISLLKLYRTLKHLDLHTKAKRYRYFRSC